MLDRKKVAVIHIAKDAVGMPENEYRVILELTFDVKSSKDLTDKQFFKFMELFEKLGYKGQKIKKVKISTEQIKKIRYYEFKLGWKDSPERLNGFIKRQTGKELTKLEWLTVEDGQKVIEGMKALYFRMQKEEKVGKRSNG